MGKVDVERLGGFAGFGLPGARLRSRGEVDPATLSAADRQQVDRLFARKQEHRPPSPDAFPYRLTLSVAGRVDVIEVDEAAVPLPLRDCVHDELN